MPDSWPGASSFSASRSDAAGRRAVRRPGRFASGMPAAPSASAAAGRPAEVSGYVMMCHVLSWGRSPPRSFAGQCSFLSVHGPGRPPEERFSRAHNARLPVRARPRARGSGSGPSTADVMMCHGGALRGLPPAAPGCGSWEVTLQSITARSWRRWASPACPAPAGSGVGFGHPCHLLPSQGRDGVSLFRASSRAGLRACVRVCVRVGQCFIIHQS